MPGPEVKDWDLYHALRRKGHSKESAAKIANSRARRRRIAKLMVEIEKRNIKRTPDYPHGRSIKWPKVYRGLRRRGMSKEQAAKISNAMSNKYRGGRRLPLSATAGKKPIPEDILDKQPELRKPGGRSSVKKSSHNVKKGQPDMSDVHTDTPLKPKKRKKRQPRELLAPRFQVQKHLGPGDHPSGSPQSVHGSGSKGHGPSRKQVSSMTEEGGFTVDAATGDAPTSGYMVALEQYEQVYKPGTLTLAKIGEYRARNWSQFEDVPNAKWGGWKDEDGTVYFDISVQFDSLDEAVDKGKQWDQKAIFHLDTFSEIRLDDDGSSLSDFKSNLEHAA